MINFLKLYFISLPVLLIIDSVWLLFVAPKFYKTHIGFLMTDKPNLVAALIFYLLFIAGLVIFVVQPGLESHSLLNTLLKGALFGLVCYATYDLTNQATINNWPTIVTVVDLIWGTLLTASVSGVVFVIASKLNV
ncbi:hypothetical protein A2380_03910 [candidate division WWE3 bacterium RIFOXYB1_FULL_43_24]|uniref:DUF2177 domain-containing protein n=2 Tax=Katanobacteria TaxID=422282 RepID=A0A0G1BNT1_UNCKA|nr:MAG: hypothetical protein UU92_C0003G0039 [candidate division WWE3 bacterium GW2011_GWA1_42_12]KKS39113.1 MAG: hypothetical protein UV00_C0004G0039 [candidate division WWE3 bacterium GW2011_GWF1_42_14]KKS40643.1 MAG: hypothetical protein UV03_C0004G0039 [candidate division WWE3 bacterium GW2011_GWE1_42_16]KKS67021.1 MAG: hypothetical protein UV35_C0004G0027 [candidate division WWE3 bacterium GW2011_GWB1_42_6]OGC60206.1 MAG: hypothetical protein A2212_03715 [candidate division WWE3 bacterium 